MQCRGLPAGQGGDQEHLPTAAAVAPGKSQNTTAAVQHTGDTASASTAVFCATQSSLDSNTTYV